MNNILKAFFALSLVLVISCQNTTRLERPKMDLSNTDFIYLNGNHFEWRNEKFFPIMLNYIVSFRHINDEFLFSPHIDYEEIGVFESNTKEAIEEQLRGHFQLISEMGFNSIRLCFDRIGCNKKRYYYGADGKEFFVDADYEKILNGLETLVNIAEEKGLRIMLLFRKPWEDKQLEDFTIKVLKRFKDNPTIFAYDLMNEPLYFNENQLKSKKEVIKTVTYWQKMMYEHAPYQLFTIGFSEPIEVFLWDPSLLPVDFVAFHTYHPLRVKSEIYWYSTYVGKPWMIGETALPADNDSIPYEDQANFMREVYQYIADCGGAGLGWWDFQEASQGNLEALFTGILNHKGTTTTQDGKYTIIGTVKPAAGEIQYFSEYIPKEKVRPVNYFNNLGYNNFLIKGKIIDKQTKKPIEGAVIRGWTQWWNIAWNTYSDENGNFTLYSNEKYIHFAISAPGFSTKVFDRKLNYKKITNENVDINNLPNKELEYHSISYKPFLKDSARSVFDFDPTKFHQAKFEADMGVVKLKNLGY